jgi:ribosomal protein L16/L10AE
VPFVPKVSNVQLREPGRYVFTLRYEDEELARTAFDLAVKKPAP